MSETFDRVKKVVMEQLGVEADKVQNSSAFIEDLRTSLLKRWNQ